MTGRDLQIRSGNPQKGYPQSETLTRGKWVEGEWIESVSDFEIEGPPKMGMGWRRDFPHQWEIGTYLTVFIIALMMRLWDLGGRAVHHDESLHGYFSWRLFTGSGFTHDPLMHGPFLFHISAGSFFLFGDNEFTLRLPAALFGAALVMTPLLLRNRLGNISSLLIAVMLAFSPSLLYFSRFARNDIFVAVWTIALVAMVWRYLDERKPKYIYLAAAFISLGFATKETQYIIVAIVAIPLVVMARKDVFGWFWGHRRLSEWSPAGGMLVLVVTLTLPMIGAASGLIQGVFGLVLANNDSSIGQPLGTADGAGEIVAVAITALLLATAVLVGVLWNRRVWLIAFGIAISIFVVFYSSVFTHWAGLASGVWQGLGYWVAQQDVARGGQPDYYYVMLTSVYEFLPATIGLVGAVYYAFKGDSFTRFLAYWPIATFAAYSLAGEKMPWLEVQVVLPFIFLGGKALGDMISSLNWQPSLSGGGAWIFAGVPVAVMVVWRLIFLKDNQSGLGGLDEASGAVVLFGILTLLGVGLFWLIRHSGSKQTMSLVGVAVVALMAILTIRTAWVVTYQEPDVPNELLVYTQTSPDLAGLSQEIEAAARLTGEGKHLKVTVDGSSGFTWPWTWYLRDYAQVSYPNLGFSRPDGPSDSSVVIVHTRNENIARVATETGFTEGRRFPHRQWFPETYKNTTWGEFFGTLFNPTEWQNALNFFVYRKMSQPIGSEDAFFYFDADIPLRALE